MKRDSAPLNPFACILKGGEEYRIRIGGIVIRFEFSEVFGPLVIGAHGQEIKQPGSRNEFWKAVTLWSRQGKRQTDGFCRWTPEPLPLLEPLGGRNYLIIGETSQDDRW